MLHLKDKVIIALLLIILLLSGLELYTWKQLELCHLRPVLTTETIVYKDAPPAPSLAVKFDSLAITVRRLPKEKKERQTTSIAFLGVEMIDTDTAAIDSGLSSIIQKRDSLTARLRDSAVAMTFSADTVHPVTKDTVVVLCDEIRRNIEISLRYAPRQEKTVFVDRSTVKEASIWDKLYYSGLGALLIEVLHLVFK